MSSLHRFFRFAGLIVSVGGLITGTVCAQASEDAKTGLPVGIVAMVNGTSITQRQLTDALGPAASTANASAVAVTRDQLVAREILRQAAERERYDRRPEVGAAVARTKENTEIDLYLRDKVRPAVVSDAQVKARYEVIVSMLGEREYKVRTMQLPDDATVGRVLARIKAGDAFESLAKQYSTAPNKGSGGDLGWISFKSPLTEGRTQGLPLPLAYAITQVQPGTVSAAPVGVGDSRYLVFVETARPTQVPSFEQARVQLRQELEQSEWQKAAAAVMAGLAKDAKIQR